ncbi:unnamed protein product [Trypanosoma congolense IL3000]|uniref:WGS project CAEQ00000000 data, annotated contig 624 n=1 Tax=Trypanosoma congolense (strain IL3000) TaxID=1068625 RepID=F9WHB1_TRYCI|nr:unnamed protein product [Trypanosoma congolense IL3000]
MMTGFTPSPPTHRSPCSPGYSLIANPSPRIALQKKKDVLEKSVLFWKKQAHLMRGGLRTHELEKLFVFFGCIRTRTGTPEPAPAHTLGCNARCVSGDFVEVHTVFPEIPSEPSLLVSVYCSRINPTTSTEFFCAASHVYVSNSSKHWSTGPHP